MFQRQIHKGLYHYYLISMISSGYLYSVAKIRGRTGNDPHYPRGNTVNDPLYLSREQTHQILIRVSSLVFFWLLVLEYNEFISETCKPNSTCLQAKLYSHCQFRFKLQDQNLELSRLIWLELPDRITRLSRFRPISIDSFRDMHYYVQM